MVHSPLTSDDAKAANGRRVVLLADMVQKTGHPQAKKNEPWYKLNIIYKN